MMKKQMDQDSKHKSDEIVGIGISRIDTVITPFENAVFEWNNYRMKLLLIIYHLLN